MTAPLTFRPAVAYERGLVSSILVSCYAEILDPAWEDRLRAFEREVFENPDTVGACTLITSVDRDIVGLVSYDPRRGPQLGIIGHNGILPPCRAQGYGTAQIREVLRIFRTRGFARAHVSTSEHPFFTPARRMYEACGFRECPRTERSHAEQYRIIHYEMSLAK
ncbi:MAG: GNAT family N-acetyltransferase [Planctomycetes bacterium]|nr:GNAT family N-acetyltransferase [Planctomycetota bacterium]